MIANFLVETTKNCFSGMTESGTWLSAGDWAKEEFSGSIRKQERIK
ncbi:hypothetical protein EYB48_05325 [Undibacterium sp. B2R-29]|nr:hypothetical protein [Undibacterium crateris]